MLTKKLYALANLIAVVAPLFNIFSANARGNAIRNSPNQVTNLLTPHPYAFSIWFIIYIGLFAFAIHQLLVAFGKTKDEDTLLKVGPYLIFALATNALWSYYWTNGYDILYSPLLLFAAYFFTLAIIQRMNMQMKKVSNAIKWYTWVPISIFSGWMMAAATVGLSSYLSSIGLGSDGSAVYWTVFVIVVVTGLYYYMLTARHLAVYALVGVWTLVAISVNQWGKIALIQWSALIAASILFGFVLKEIMGDKTRKFSWF